MLIKAKTLKGYKLHSKDGEIGKVKEFYFDDKHWAIRYLVIDTASWWVGKKVLVSPQWIDHVSWEDNKVFVNLSRESIKQSPEYSEENLLTRDYETQLHRYYNRNVYWKDQAGKHWK
jgi:hypothetical protein